MAIYPYILNIQMKNNLHGPQPYNVYVKGKVEGRRDCCNDK